MECPEEIPSSETVKERAGGILASLAERHKSVDMKVDGKKVILALNDGEGIPFYREKKKDISPEKELAKVYEDLDDIKTLVSMIA